MFVTFSRSRPSIIFAGRLEPNRVELLTAAKSFIVQAPGGWDLKYEQVISLATFQA